MRHNSHAHADFARDGTLRTSKQSTGTALLSFILPAIVIVMLAGCGNDNKAPAAGSDGPDAAAVASRIAPVAKVAIKAGSSPSTTPAGAGEAALTAASAPVAAEAAPVEAPAAAPAAVATAAPAGAAPDLYTQACSVCHAAGIAGAPKYGDKAAWAPRLAAGVDGLTASAIKGKNAMPPRGGSKGSDADIKAVVAYMVEAVK